LTTGSRRSTTSFAEKGLGLAYALEPMVREQRVMGG
jgi:hypothetical protein